MSLRLLFAIALAIPLLADSGADKRLDAAAETIQEVMQISERTIPQSLLDRSHCVVVVPGLKKGAFFFGAEFGRGFVSCRGANGVGWSPPAAVRMEGGSFGLQLGGQEIDVVMLVMNEKGARRLMQSKFTLGGDAAVAAGPVGRNVEAQTDALLSAEILTWSRTRGVFAGISLQGATLRADKGINEELYGQPWTTREVVNSGLEPTEAAKPLMSLLNRYSSRQVN